MVTCLLLLLAGSLNVSGLDVDWNKMFSLPTKYWEEDIAESRKFLVDQAGCDLPQAILDELSNQEKRIKC